MNANARSATSTMPRHLGRFSSAQCLTRAVSRGCSSLNPVGNMMPCTEKRSIELHTVPRRVLCFSVSAIIRADADDV